MLLLINVPFITTHCLGKANAHTYPSIVAEATAFSDKATGLFSLRADEIKPVSPDPEQDYEL